MKKIFPSLIHTICIVHNLHLVCETIRENFYRANDFTCELKKILNKNKENQKIYYNSTNLPLPKYPVITRWGTFIDFNIFIFQNRDKIKLFIENLPNSEKINQ